MDCSLPGSSIHGISQARILEWVAISFSRVSSWPRDQTCVSCIGRWILYHWATWEAPPLIIADDNKYGMMIMTTSYWALCVYIKSDRKTKSNIGCCWGEVDYFSAYELPILSCSEGTITAISATSLSSTCLRVLCNLFESLFCDHS